MLGLLCLLVVLVVGVDVAASTCHSFLRAVCGRAVIALQPCAP